MDPSNYRSFYAAIQNASRVPGLNPATGFLYGRRPVLDPEGDGARVALMSGAPEFPKWNQALTKALLTGQVGTGPAAGKTRVITVNPVPEPAAAIRETEAPPRVP